MPIFPTTHAYTYVYIFTFIRGEIVKEASIDSYNLLLIKRWLENIQRNSEENDNNMNQYI